MEHLFIPLYRRIQEIMKERGKLSQEYVASRIGIHRDTFRAVLRGERPIYGTELRKLAEVLKVSIDRLNQTDIIKEITILDQRLNRLDNMDQALKIAEKFHSLAVGNTERVDALNYMGRVYYARKEYNKAHEYFLQAYDLALLVFLGYGETDRLHDISKNLMICYAIRKDFTNAQQHIEQLKPHIQDHPAKLGMLYYSLAMIAHGNGDLQETKTYLYESLLYAEQTGDAQRIGNAQHCVAYIEYLLGNLTVSKTVFEQAMRTLSCFTEPKLNAAKDYLKVLLKLGQTTEVQRLLREYEDSISQLCNRDLQTKFQLLRMIANNDLSLAQRLLTTEETSQNQKRIACRFIMEHYLRVDDLQSFIRYYQMERSFTETVPLFDEEGL